MEALEGCNNPVTHHILVVFVAAVSDFGHDGVV